MYCSFGENAGVEPIAPSAFWTTTLWSPARTCVMQAPSGVGLADVVGVTPDERMHGEVDCLESLYDIFPASVTASVALNASCSSPPLIR